MNLKMEELENTVLALKNDLKEIQTKYEIQENAYKIQKEAIFNCKNEIKSLRLSNKKKDEANQVNNSNNWLIIN